MDINSSLILKQTLTYFELFIEVLLKALIAPKYDPSHNEMVIT